MEGVGVADILLGISGNGVSSALMAGGGLSLDDGLGRGLFVMVKTAEASRLFWILLVVVGHCPKVLSWGGKRLDLLY